VIERIAGQFIGVVYSLLHNDYNTLNALEQGQDMPEPVLYDHTLHHAHRTGHRTPTPAVNLTVELISTI
jgi:hypothetical protein